MMINGFENHMKLKMYKLAVNGSQYVDASFSYINLDSGSVVLNTTFYHHVDLLKNWVKFRNS